jgi:LysM repeat protein
MTDDAQKKGSGRWTDSPWDADFADEASGGRAPREWVDSPSAAPPEPDESLAALERLQSLSSGAAANAPAKSDAPRSSGSTSAPRPLRRASLPRRRSAAAAGSGTRVARLVAPAAFLVAVIALVVILFQTGMIGGADQTPVTPASTSTKTKSGGGTSATAGTRSYRIKSGDTLSAVAEKFNTSVSEIESLNSGMDSTLVPGEVIVVPRP